jgi:hypothetical protein
MIDVRNCARDRSVSTVEVRETDGHHPDLEITAALARVSRFARLRGLRDRVGGSERGADRRKSTMQIVDRYISFSLIGR